MRCCRPSCSLAMLAVGGFMASGEIGRRLIAAIPWTGWMWLLIMLAVVLLAIALVMPSSAKRSGDAP